MDAKFGGLTLICVGFAVLFGSSTFFVRFGFFAGIAVLAVGVFLLYRGWKLLTRELYYSSNAIIENLEKHDDSEEEE